MPFSIVRNDITRMQVDAIVNSAAPHLLGGGGADGAIHRAAGPELKKACQALGGCKTGQVKLTKGYRLPCRYVIHTVGPVWLGGLLGEEEKLRACYRNAMGMAKEYKLESIAFPLISSGVFAFPREKAIRIAMDEIGAFVLENDLMVYLVVYDRESFRIGSQLQQEIRQYIDDRYVAQHQYTAERRIVHCSASLSMKERQRSEDAYEENMPLMTSSVLADEEEPELCEAAPVEYCASLPDWAEEDVVSLAPALEEEERCVPGAAPSTFATEEDHEEQLRRLLGQRDESFTQMLLRKIDESGMSDPECYRRANVDRRLFSKIRNNPHYQPSKQTALAFAVALRMDRHETEDLLRTAGLALSRSSKFDIIVEYCLMNRIYDIHQVNRILYDFDQMTLGV